MEKEVRNNLLENDVCSLIIKGLETTWVLIHAPDDLASFLRYPLMRFLMRGGWKRCGGCD
jgi:hypothetical protein